MTIKPPDTRGELTVAAIKAMVGLVPYAGVVLVEGVELFNPIKKRREAWEQLLTTAVVELQQHHSLTIEQIMRNDAFVSFVYQASDIALRNHQTEKLHALRNAIVSVGKPEQIDEDLAFQFLRYVEVLTVTHVAILATIWNKHEEAFKGCTTLGGLYEQLKVFGFAELDRQVARAFLKDLQAMNLLSLVDLGDYEEFESTASVTWTSDTTHVKPPVVSDIGQKFLQFIGRPQQTAKATNTSAAPSP